MTREDIIRMAREAEDKVIANENLDWKAEFASLVAAEEREACAKVCEDKALRYTERAECPVEIRDIKPEWARIATQTCGHVAVAIRARGQA